MKKNKCFGCKEKKHIAYNYFKERKIAAILKDVSKNSNSQRKETSLFLHYFY